MASRKRTSRKSRPRPHARRRYGHALAREKNKHTAELDDGSVVAMSPDLLALREPAVEWAKRLGKRVTVRHAWRNYEPVWRTGRDGGLRDMRGKPVAVGYGLDHHGRPSA